MIHVDFLNDLRRHVARVPEARVTIHLASDVMGWSRALTRDVLTAHGLPDAGSDWSPWECKS